MRDGRYDPQPQGAAAVPAAPHPTAGNHDLRLYFVAVCGTVWALAIVAQLFHLQVLRHKLLLKEAQHQSDRTITVKAVVANPRRELQTGMFIEARLETARRNQAVLVPEEAVLALPAGNFIWVVQGDTPERRPVKLGTRQPGFVEILEGVADGESVVVGGAERLTPGSKVRIGKGD